MVIYLFGLHQDSATLLNGNDDLYSVQLFYEETLNAKSLSFKATLAGTSTYKVYMRYWNGLNWLDWQLMQMNDSALTSIFGGLTDYPSGTILQINILLQQFVLDGMKGMQFKFVRESGSGNIVFTEGYAIAN